MEQSFFPVTRREAERQGVQYSSKANKNSLFPSRLRELRAEKGVSQEALSKVLGVSKSTIGLWENGDTLPDAKAVFDLADYYEVSTDYLVRKTEIKSTEMSLKSVCNYTGLSEKAIRQLYLLYHHPQCKTPESGGLGIMAKGYSIGHTDILSEILESQHMLEFFNCIGFYLVYGGALPNDAYTNNEDELTSEEHQRFYRWANTRGLEIQPRKDVCEMHLQKACDELKNMLKDILEKVKRGNG